MVWAVFFMVYGFLAGYGATAERATAGGTKGAEEADRKGIAEQPWDVEMLRIEKQITS